MVAAAVIGSAVVGGVTSSMAANSAASAQANASNAANRAAAQQFERQVQLQAPFRQGGLTAQQQYMTLLGLSPPTVYAGGSMTPPSLTGANGHKLTGQALRNAQANAAQPPELYADLNNPEFGKYARDFSMADFEADPGYAFRLEQGLKALEGRAAARGGLLSGNTLRGVTDYGQNAASQEYTNAFNRYQVNRANRLNPLENLMGAARSSTNQLAGAANVLGQTESQNIQNAGQARASGYIGSSNALSSALNNGINQYQDYQLMNNLFPSGSNYAAGNSSNYFGYGGGGGSNLNY
jgi:hypothetical protein